MKLSELPPSVRLRLRDTIIWGSWLMMPFASASDTSPPGITWRVGVGSAYRTFGSIHFETGSYADTISLPLLVPGSSVNNPFGPASGFADRSYDDGFVFQDINTANPKAFLPGTTAFWSYQNNGQVQGGSLVFTGSGTNTVVSQTIASAVNPGWEDRPDGVITPSFDVAAMIDLTPYLRVGASFNFMAPRMKTGKTSTTFSATQQSQTFTSSVTDAYDLQGVVPPFAPYTGVFDPPGPAVVIDNVPTHRSLVTTPGNTLSAVFANRIDESLELQCYIFSFGPMMEYQHGRLSAGASFGVAANVVDWKASFKEQLTGQSGGVTTRVATWQAERSEVDVLGSLYLQLQLACAITPKLSVQVFGRRDWMSALSATVGPSSFTADLGGYTLGAGIQYRF